MQKSLLARYASGNLPRYTSYPTAPNFSAQVGEADYRRWLAGLREADSASLYLHVPFCRAMCWYCGCHTTVTSRPEPVARYLAALEREAGLVADAAGARIPIEHLHFGGGTPTLMAPEGLAGLMAGLEQNFDLAADAERAIEIDPRTLDEKMVRALAAAGFNRASLGVQSFDPRVQRAINRVQTFVQTAEACASLRRHGIARVNFDLLYGLPHQDVASCLSTVRLALELEPDRLAVFGYAHVPAFKPHQRRIESEKLPDTANRLDQSEAIAEALVKAGYVRIGIDHFARPDDDLACAARNGRLRRNFQGYTTDGAEVLIGLGASAIGQLPQGFVQNVVAIRDYEAQVAQGRLPVVRGYATSAEDRLRAEIIERLMCDYRVDVGAVCARAGRDPADLIDRGRLDALAGDGLIERCGTVVQVRPEARALVRSVAAAFDAYLPGNEGRHARAV